jgi:hypothetical protein
MEVTKMNEKEQAIKDLETIKSFLEEGQNNLKDSGFHFMFWGILIPLSVGGFYALFERFGGSDLFAKAYWSIACGIGAVVSLIFGMVAGKREKSRGFASRVHALLWVGLLSAIAVTFLIQIAAARPVTSAFLAQIAILLGIAYWVHGSLLRLTWFSLVGILWWIAAIALSFTDIVAASFILSGATFLCSFIPGVILSRRSRRR